MKSVFDRGGVMTSGSQGRRILITDREVMGPLASEAIRSKGVAFLAGHRRGAPRSVIGDLTRHIALRFRRWREDRQTWAALSYLDDGQLKEFGIPSRPPDLTLPRFP